MATAPDTSMTVIPMNDDAPATPTSLAARFQPTNLSELKDFAKIIVLAGTCPTNSAADALLMMMTGAGLGLNVMQSLLGIHVIKGKPVLSADMMMAVALQHPDCSRFVVTAMEEEVARVEVMRKGWERCQVYEFTKADAKRAGLWGRGNWATYPKAMLKARAISSAAKASFPDALLGVYVEGELDDVPAQTAVVEARSVPVEQPAPRSKKNTDPADQFEERSQRTPPPLIDDPAIAHEVNRLKAHIEEAQCEGLSHEATKAYVEHVCQLFEVERTRDMTAEQLGHVNGKLAALHPDERAGYMLKVSEGVTDNVILPLPGHAPPDRQKEIARFCAIASEPFKKESSGTKDTAESFRQALKVKWGVESFNDVEVNTITKAADALKALDLKSRHIHMTQMIKEVEG